MENQQNDTSAQQHLWKSLETIGVPQGFRRHGYIYTPGMPAHALFLLVSGQVSLQMLSSGGRVLTLKVVDPGQLFGLSTLDGAPNYDTYAEALTPVRVIAVPQATVLHAIGTTPHLGLALIEQIGQHRSTIGRRIEEVAFKSVPARLASVLLEMSESDTNADRVLPRRTHQQLAEMINAYRETVTKVINQFRDARLLDVDRSGIRLLNRSRLRELSQS